MDTIPAILRAAAQKYGDDPAYVDGERVLSFAELLDQVRATAAGYRSRGFRPGERAAVWAPNSIDWVIAALAAAYAGYLASNVVYDLWWDDFHWVVLGTLLALDRQASR